jgi:hypothetical protein
LTDEDGKGWQVILADCRNLPKCEGREVHPPAFVPIHIPKTSYEMLGYERFVDCLVDAMDKLGLPVLPSTAGTLGNLGMFYMSLDLGTEIKGGRGEILKPYLSAYTSNNGMYRPTFKDTITRIVCANTLAGANRELSNLEIIGKHTANGLSSIDNMGPAIEMFFKGMATLETIVLPALQSEGMDSIAMRETVAGYFLQPALERDSRVDIAKLKLSKQAQNAMEGIVELARRGKGNAGETAYDLWNGATDYWSNGAGVGSDTVGLSKRAYRSNFGSGATHKTAFSEYLFSHERRTAGREMGRKVIANSMELAG